MKSRKKYQKQVQPETFPLTFGKSPVMKTYSDIVAARKGLSIYREMMLDDQVKSALEFKKHAILSSGWSILPADESDEARQQAEWCIQTLNAMEGSFEDDLYELLSALEYGFAISEIVWATENGQIIPVALHSKPVFQVRFKTDEFGNILQEDGIMLWNLKLNLKNFILFRHGAVHENPYGTSDLQAAYRMWWFKDNLLKWFAMLLEQFGIPPKIAKFKKPIESIDVSKMQDILKNLQSNTSIITPEGWEFEFPQVVRSGSDVFISALQEANKSITRALLIPSLLGVSQQEDVGSYAQSKIHYQTFITIITTIQKRLAEVIKMQLLKRMVEYNFPNPLVPEFVFNPLQEPEKTHLFDIFKTAIQTGLVSLSEDDLKFLKKQTGFPIIEVQQEQKEQEQQLQLHEHKYKLNHPPRNVERKINFQAIENDIEKSILAGRMAIIKEIETGFQQIGSRIENIMELTPLQMMELEFPNKTGIARVVKDWFEMVIEKGRDSAFRDLPPRIKRKFSLWHKIKKYFIYPQDAYKYFKAKQLEVSGILSDALTKELHQVLLTGLKNGEDQRTIIKKLDERIQKYTGDETALVDGEPLEPYRLETILRTNFNEAYNEGRKILFQSEDVKDFIIGYAYSSILDDRTTPICEFLGKGPAIFRPDDPALDQLTPPNHFNCRSVLVPVLDDEAPVEYISDADIQQAIGMKSAGF